MKFIDVSYALMASGASIAIFVLRTRTRRRVQRALRIEEQRMTGTNVEGYLVAPETERTRASRFPNSGA